MRAVRRIGTIIALAAVGVVLSSVSAMAQPPSAVDTQSGSCAADPNTADCSWVNTTPGTAGRPYLKYLAVTNGGTKTVVVDNTASSVQTPTPVAGTDLYAVVATQNACAAGQAPAQGVCYNPPNRVAVYLKHLVGSSWTDDFTTSTSSNPAITTSSVIDLIIGFHSAYSTLRWSWVNGVPSYWRNTVAAGADGEIQVRFSPRTMPVMSSGGCSQIPVSTCDIAQATSEQLRPQLLLSMDTTLDAGLTGALFGTDSAFIGSLDMSPAPPGGAATLTYGIAAPHLNADGSPRVGSLYALLSSPMLTLLGTSVAAFDSTILNVTRTGDPGTSSSAWAGWTAAANGTDGQFLTISNISFSAPKFLVQKSSASNSKGKTPTLKVGSKVTLKQLLALGDYKVKAGSKVSAKVSTPKICKVVGNGIKGLAVGTCRGSMTITPKTGKPSKKAFTFKVTKTGKRLPVMLHH
jgi:hypothetical protein